MVLTATHCFNILRPHLSGIELEEGKIGLTGDPVEAEDAVHHPSPNPDQTICNSLACIRQPGARASQLPPDHVHHVVLVVFLLESHVLILTQYRTVGSVQSAQLSNELTI